MKILVLTSTFPVKSGDSSPGFVSELCSRLNNSEIQIDVLSPHAYGSKTNEIVNGIQVYRYRYFIDKLQTLAYGSGILENIKKNPFKIILLPFFLTAQFIATYSRLAKGNYDLVHAHWLIPQGFIAICVTNLIGKGDSMPVVCTSHGSDLLKLNGLFLDKLKAWTINHCKHVVVVSNYMKQICSLLNINQDHISVIPMGVDLEGLFKPDKNINRNRKRLIYVGRLIKSKGILKLLEALTLIRIEIPDIELLIVGDGHEKNLLTNYVNEKKLNENVIFNGPAKYTDLPALYSSASILVFPSISQEGLGLVVIEALGCGCIVVASEMESLHGVVKVGHNGILVPINNHMKLAEAVTSILTDTNFYQSMFSNTTGSVYPQHDWQEVTRQYQELFTRMFPDSTS